MPGDIGDGASLSLLGDFETGVRGRFDEGTGDRTPDEDEEDEDDDDDNNAASIVELVCGPQTAMCD